MTGRFRVVGLVASAVLALLMAATTAAADTAQPPHITSVSPGRIPTGQPIRITVTGTGFSGISSVTTEPPASSQSFQIFNDTTILLTLPAETPVGSYVIHVTTPAGTDISPNAFTVIARAVVTTPAPAVDAPRPAVSLAPAPEVVTAPAPVAEARPVGAGDATLPPNPATAGRTDHPINPVVAALLGFAIGGLLYVLWGREGRLRLARRHGLLAQIWARPVQRLHLGRICLHCGRLHYVVGTRRDLWKAGQFCSATCFVASAGAELAVAESEEFAPSRLNGVGVYVDMEKQLQAALRAEAADLGSALFATGGAANSPLAPASSPPVARGWLAERGCFPVAAESGPEPATVSA